MDESKHFHYPNTRETPSIELILEVSLLILKLVKTLSTLNNLSTFVKDVRL